jgi:hypothetical protein
MIAGQCRRKSIPPANRRKFRHAWDEAVYVYHKLAYWSHDRQDRSTTCRYAKRLEKLLRSLPDNMEAIVGAMGWAIICELKGDMENGIAHRERIVKAIHRAQARSPNDVFIAALRPLYTAVVYGRLAELYVETGRPRQAIRVLRRSKAFCEKYGIEFQCQNMLDRLLREQSRGTRKAQRPSRSVATATGSRWTRASASRR